MLSIYPKLQAVAEEASLSHTWSQIPEDRFSCDMAYLLMAKIVMFLVVPKLYYFFPHNFRVKER